MRLAAHQPQYLPWLGFFDKMDAADLFVLLDTVQFKKNEWQNRNRIRTPDGWQWLTVPVRYRFPMRIDEVLIDETSRWRRKHRQALITHYSRASYGREILDALEPLLEGKHDRLVSLNVHSIKALSELLGVTTPLILASTLGGSGECGADRRLIDLCGRLGCDTYIAGAGGQRYMNLEDYARAGIEVVFQDFHHPVHVQVPPGFEPNLSSIDCLMNCGPGSIRLLRSEREVNA